MTVSELIQKLQTMPPDALVVTDGYEDGYDSIKKVSVIKVEEIAEKKWYIGKYVSTENPNAFDVVFLNADTKADDK